jgi:hypothetical protein
MTTTWRSWQLPDTRAQLRYPQVAVESPVVIIRLGAKLMHSNADLRLRVAVFRQPRRGQPSSMLLLASRSVQSPR